MNALADEDSPYLRQHAGNPVDWLPWGAEAHRRAVEQDKPLLVSIGYSACHWCHVMERESFEDEQIAALMNERFVCVKVDREERPDVDALCMEYVQGLTGQGGWPLHCFLTPERTPFYGGTYFPPAEGQGMPSWPQVLHAVSDAWRTKRDEILAAGADVTQRLVGGAALRPAGDDVLTDALLTTAVERIEAQFDSVHGGWGGAPKFPAASVTELLLRRGRPQQAVMTLKAMAGGGIVDQVAGGFARYSVDATWTVPHFEKMLYDNALLARASLHAFQATQDPELRRVCVETLDWVLADLRAPEGGFFSALDADSEGVEGKFYVWTVDELRAVLGDDADDAIRWFGATEQGNFVDHHHPELTGLNVLEDRGPRPDDEQRERIRAKLLGAREARVRPGLDDKRLTAWNALAITAFADAGAVLQEPRYLDAARDAATFLLTHLRDAAGRLLRASSGGPGRILGYLEDHAFLLEATIVLFEATGEPRWLVEAIELAEQLLARFHDDEHGGFFSTAADHDDAPGLRRKDLEDHPVPAGGSSAALGLLRLAALTGERRYHEAATGQLRLVAGIASRHPTAFAHLLQAVDLHVHPPKEVAIVGPAGPEREALVAVVHERLRGDVVLAVGDGQDEGGVALLADRPLGPGGGPAAYVCEGFACRAPVYGQHDLRTLLDP